MENMVIEVNLKFWLLFLLLFMVVMALVGSLQWEMSSDGKIRRVYPSKILDTVAVMMAVGIGIMMVLESFGDLVLWLDGGLSEADHSAWSVILAPIVIIIIGATFAALLSQVGVIAGYAKEGYLREKLRQERRGQNKPLGGTPPTTPLKAA